nr:hypothetical protein [uncultured Rhodopila sp.]
MQAFYTARQFETTGIEARQGFPFKAQPMTLCAYEVDWTLSIRPIRPLGAAQRVTAADLAVPRVQIGDPQQPIRTAPPALPHTPNPSVNRAFA